MHDAVDADGTHKYGYSALRAYDDAQPTHPSMVNSELYKSVKDSDAPHIRGLMRLLGG